MTKDFQLAWMLYALATLVLLAAAWWFMHNWRKAWLRHYLLLTMAAVLLVPAYGRAPDGPPVPVLPLFIYQTLFEENGASPEVSANLVFAIAGSLLAALVLGVLRWMMSKLKGHHRA